MEDPNPIISKSNITVSVVKIRCIVSVKVRPVICIFSLKCIGKKGAIKSTIPKHIIRIPVIKSGLL